MVENSGDCGNLKALGRFDPRIRVWKLFEQIFWNKAGFGTVFARRTVSENIGICAESAIKAPAKCLQRLLMGLRFHFSAQPVRCRRTGGVDIPSMPRTLSRGGLRCPRDVFVCGCPYVWEGVFNGVDNVLFCTAYPERNGAMSEISRRRFLRRSPMRTGVNAGDSVGDWRVRCGLTKRRPVEADGFGSLIGTRFSEISRVCV